MNCELRIVDLKADISNRKSRNCRFRFPLTALLGLQFEIRNSRFATSPSSISVLCIIASWPLSNTQAPQISRSPLSLFRTLYGQVFNVERRTLNVEPALSYHLNHSLLATSYMPPRPYHLSIHPIFHPIFHPLSEHNKFPYRHPAFPPGLYREDLSDLYERCLEPRRTAHDNPCL